MNAPAMRTQQMIQAQRTVPAAGAHLTNSWVMGLRKHRSKRDATDAKKWIQSKINHAIMPTEHAVYVRTVYGKTAPEWFLGHCNRAAGIKQAHDDGTTAAMYIARSMAIKQTNKQERKHR